MAEARPYKPSWLDFVLTRLRRLPFPPLIFFVLIYAIFLVLMHIPLWLDGSLVAGTFMLVFAVDAIWIPYGLGYIYFLEVAANQSIRQFRPALPEVGEREYEDIAYRFTTLPAWPTLILTIVGIAFGVGEGLRVPLPFSGELIQVFRIAYVLFSSMGYAFLPIMVYTAIRHLFQIHNLFDRVQKVNLFNLQPLYGLSGVAMMVGGFFVFGALISFWGIELYNREIYVDVPAASADDIVLIISVGVALLALVALILPLYGIHNKIEDEKRRVLAELGDQVDELRNDLQTDIRAKTFENIQGLERGINALFNMRNNVTLIPAWPWKPGALRNFFTAIGLPLFIWLMQRVLSQYL